MHGHRLELHGRKLAQRRSEFAQWAQAETDCQYGEQRQQRQAEQEGGDVVPGYFPCHFIACLVVLPDQHIEAALLIALPVIAPIFALPVATAVTLRRYLCGSHVGEVVGTEQNAWIFFIGIPHLKGQRLLVFVDVWRHRFGLFMVSIAIGVR